MRTTSRGEEEKIVGKLNFNKLVDILDYDKLFDGLLTVVLSSPLGGMLAMFGGNSALDPMREPFSKKMGEEIVRSFVRNGNSGC